MLSKLRKQLDDKEISVVELTDQFLDRVEETNETLNSFITVSAEKARERAEHAQQEIDNGNGGSLTGIPYAAKDLFVTKGIRTTSGSKMLTDYVPPYNATAVERLHDSPLLGKANMDEFAMGSSNEHSAYGPVLNPFHLKRVAGGSSGGSAAAVASGQAPFTLGTDTCGSIRLPASFCGIVGFKPTYGRIPRTGVISMASSLDTVGPMTGTVKDAAMILDALAGPDQLDTTALQESGESFVPQDSSLKGKTVGVPKEYVELEGLDPSVRELFDATITKLQAAGATIKEISLPHTAYGLATYYVLCPAEVHSNMARFDGIQYGTPHPDAQSLDDVFAMTREAGFGDEVKRRILTGAFCLSAGHVDAFYKKAQQVRTLVIQDFTTAFQDVDVIASPAASSTAFELGDKIDDPLAMYATDVYAAPSSLAGVPALSMPMGDVDGLPVGLQLIGDHLQEKELLSTAHAIEQELSITPPTLAV
jgi:aspartyl-tRNA(Asn)/glutamyl-tRNA(Gln) amidotransferase subunit A